MLIDFRVENHRSILEEQVLTFEVGPVGDPADPRARRVEGHKHRLLPTVALYGANASGKSNVLAALAFMRDAVTLSQRAWPPEGGVPRDPFAWGAATAEPSFFEVTFLLEGVRYRYGFTATSERFVEEWLYAWPRQRQQTWFERDGDSFEFGEHLQGENRLVEQVTRPNALFLSAAVQLRHAQLTPVYGWFRALRTINLPGRQRRLWPASALPEFWLWRALEPGSASEQPLLGDDETMQARFAALMRLLRAADFGIVDLKVEEDDNDSRVSRGMARRRRILVRHRNSSAQAWLPLEEESQGTQALFRMGPELLDCLSGGRLLLIDELEASLHPLLALQVLRLFNEPRTNPNHAQLLFTTHDTHLVGTLTGDPPMRRDQIWLTEKNDEGATSLYPLTDYKPRKAENVERGYLQGRYGAIPYLGELATLEA